MKKIAILGSSGGNLYNAGGKNPQKLIREIEMQSDSAGIEIAAIQFVGAEKSMDNANENTKARLYTWDREVAELKISEQATLAEIK